MEETTSLQTDINYMNTLTYKGYTGEYELYNDGADSATYYAGSIPSVKHKAVVLFEGDTINELTEDFHSAVEECIANGYQPQEKKHRITVSAVLFQIGSIICCLAACVLISRRNGIFR